MEIVPLEAADVAEVARVHHEAFGGRAALSLAHLGPEFLAQGFYALGLDNPHFHCDVARHGRRVLGFVLSTTDHGALVRRMVLAHPLRLGAAFARALMRRPSVLRAALGNLRFARGWRPPAAEGAGWGMVIATAPEARSRQFLREAGRHVGEALLGAMEERMRARGCRVWFGLTEQDNAPMINLLRRRNARLGGRVRVQGEEMLLWEIDLAREAGGRARRGVAP